MGIFRKAASRYLGNEAGSILPMAAGLLPVIVGMAGIGVDVSSWVLTKRDLQTAADAAVVAAAWEVANGFEDYAEFAATKEAQANGYRPGEGAELNLSVEEVDGRTVVTASIRQKANVYFSGMFLKGDVYLANAAASAVIVESDGRYCMLSLEEEDDGAIQFSGNVNIDASGCGLAINSSSDDALVINGAAGSYTVGEVSMVGGFDDQHQNIEYASLNTGARAVRDPYEDLEVPEGDPCGGGGGSTTLKKNGDLPGADGDGITTFCGDVTIKGDIQLPPGTYIIDGGDLNVSQGSLAGEGVTIVMINSSGGDVGSISAAAQVSIDLTAPTPDQGAPMTGVAIYQAPSPSGNVPSNRFRGGATVDIQGAFYAPQAEIDFAGNTSTSEDDESCTQFIAKKIWLHGDVSVGSSCEGTGVRPIGERASGVKLIL